MALSLLFAGCDALEVVNEADNAVVGSTSDAIVGGSPTADYPAIAQIRTTFDDGTGGNCTGSLISPRVVLTAAHCVDPEEPGLTVSGVEARFGPTSASNPNFFETIAVEDYDWFQNWDFSGDDLALLLLEHDALADPVPYNTTSLDSGDIGTPMTFVGFGVTSEGGSDDGTKRVVTTPLQGFQNSLLLEYGTTEKTTCSGDSGGPGFIRIGGQDKVASITSYHVIGCAAQVGGSRGTRVAAYKDVIAQYIAANDVVIPPEVSFAEPQNNAEVRDGFAVRIEATDNTRIERVEVYVNGVLSNTHTTSPYVEYVEGLPEGIATIEARAYDNRGDSDTASISVQIVPGSGLGDACVANEECSSNLCATVGGDSLCTIECTADEQCGEGFECLDGAACWPKSGGGGGCRTTGSPANGLWIVLGVGLFVGRRRRRR